MKACLVPVPCEIGRMSWGMKGLNVEKASKGPLKAEFALCEFIALQFLTPFQMSKARITLR
jgi:hypothetical protein